MRKAVLVFVFSKLLAHNLDRHAYPLHTYAHSLLGCFRTFFGAAHVEMENVGFRRPFLSFFQLCLSKGSTPS